MAGDTLVVRRGGAEDLDPVNAVVDAAVMTWDLPERVKRLALPSYRYHAHDLGHVELLVAEVDGRIAGVAALEDLEARESPAGMPALLLHGLYVDPGAQRRGLGTRLLEAAREHAGEEGRAGLLVRANREARGFFEARGLEPLPVRDESRDYPYRFWLPVATAEPHRR